jgi:hypothetical protein
VTTRRGYTILGWLVWQIGSRIAKRKASQKMAENRVKLGLAGTVLLVVGGILAALAARSRGSGDDEPARRKMGQMVAENRVKLGLAGTVLLVVCGILVALAARSRRSGGDEPAPAAPAATSSDEGGPKDEGPDYGEGPGSPEPGHPVGETHPVGGVPEKPHEHPEDVKPPPATEDEQHRTQSPGRPPDPESG